MTFAIIGLGRSGKSAQQLLLRTGVSPDQILTFDQKSPEADTQDPLRLQSFGAGDVFVVSPGVSPKLPWIVEAAARGVRITSEIGLASEQLGGEKIIGVTGSVGKSTTVALLGEGARVVDRHCFVGGNFGIPFCEYILGVLSGRRPRARWVILELSSFQLENCGDLKLDLGAITSFVANHLERHASRDEYYEIKWSLVSRTRGPVFVNALGGDLLSWAKTHGPATSVVKPSDLALSGLHLEDSRLLGSHNQENLALATEVARAAQWPVASIEAMKKFPGLSHRLQNLGSTKEIVFINDSKATAMESVLSAVRSSLPLVKPAGRLFLLLGGKDKNLPWKDLAVFKDRTSIEPVFFGACAETAQSQSGLPGEKFPQMKPAVESLLKKAKAGDVILLSPGGSSLDEFKSFEERGNRFAEILFERGFIPSGTTER